MDRVLSIGMMAPAIRVSSNTMTLQAKADIPGAMAGTTLATGRVTKCTEKASLSGTMAVFTKEASFRIASMAMACLRGQTDASMRGLGRMESRMESELSPAQAVRNRKDNGKKANLFSFSTTMQLCQLAILYS